MRKVLLAVASLGLLASEAAAQYYPPPGGYRPPPPVYAPPPPPVYAPPPPAYGYGPPPGQWRHRRPYDWCQVKAQRLQEFEYRMQMDGRVSRDEVRIAQSLRADLANSCGGGRWEPNRGWHYR